MSKIKVDRPLMLPHVKKIWTPQRDESITINAQSLRHFYMLCDLVRRPRQESLNNAIAAYSGMFYRRLVDKIKKRDRYTTRKPERWKSILDGAYEVSSHGNMRRLAPGSNTYKGRPLKPSLRNGYSFVGLVHNGKQKSYSVHSLVAAAFIGECPIDHEVNHRDCNRSNNYVGNLEYVTRHENAMHKTAMWEMRGGKYQK